MPDVKIKGYSGAELEYQDVPKVYLAAPESTAENPVLVPFSYGDVVEGTEIIPDFAAGDMTVSVPEGYLVKSAVIKKPETLIPENIAKDVEIAGITGTHEGGGSAELRYVTFMDDTGTVEYGKKAVAVGDDCADPIARGVFDTPTKEAEPGYEYEFTNSWSMETGGVSNGDELLQVTEDRTLYAVFDKFPAGKAGETAKWKLKNGTLIISGDGEMEDYKSASSCEWYGYRDDVTSVLFEEGITKIGAHAFNGYSNLKSVTIADTIHTINYYAFYNCTNLKQYISCKATVIGLYAFSGSGITGITFVAGTTKIYYGVCADCPNIATVVIPDGVTIIDNGAIARTSVATVNIPDSVESIGMTAFASSNNLKSITIGSGVKIIGKSAFYYAGLTSVTFKNTTGWYAADSATATSGTTLSSSSLANKSTAATLLSSNYAEKYWIRS